MSSSLDIPFVNEEENALQLKILLAFLLIGSLIEQLSAIEVSLGPEIYYMKRERHGGTHQSGRMDGVRICIERFKRYGWYLGAEYFYANGELKGENTRGNKLNSEVTDNICELRAGYTLQKSESPASFTPLIGIGYFHETNQFFSPSPIQFHFTDSFEYVVAGFIASHNLTPCLSIGLNFRADFMIFGRSKITHDPMYEDTTLDMERALQTRVEVPISINLNQALSAELVPFYEHRRFGGREGYPFDFVDTQFQLLGMRIALTYCY